MKQILNQEQIKQNDYLLYSFSGKPEYSFCAFVHLPEKNRMKKIFYLFLLLLLPFFAKAEVSLAHIFGNNMMLQRDTTVEIWGWADQNEKVEVQFNGQKRQAKADANGNWRISLSPMEYGGPFEMTVKGKKNSILLSNILIGDVWLCSGQSNMEWRVNAVNNAAYEMENGNYPEIRSFNVNRAISLSPEKDFEGKWEVCTPATVGKFSAVAYFFARKIHQETGVPIAIINSSWGGTDIEAWISGGAFKTLPDEYKTRSDKTLLDASFSAEENNKNKIAYENALKNDIGFSEKWYDTGFGSTDWGTVRVPALWKVTSLTDALGIVWFKQTFTLSEIPAKDITIHLGPVDDEDIVWINGIKVGENKVYNLKRVYTVPADVLRKGENTITVRVYNSQGEGGIYGKPEELFMETETGKIPLNGEWKYRTSVTSKDFGYRSISPNTYPSSLYNGMINPVTGFRIKGAIWYQGENNVGRTKLYQTLFPLLINDWRKHWGYDFPFYWVQLANFLQEDIEPKESAWAELREAQTMTLSVPKTGQAVIIDIGEASDIHPRNKQDVGLRLALIALNKDYNRKDLIYSGPVYKSMKIEDGKVIVSFDNTGTGLDVHDKYGYLKGFAVAGADRKFVWAKADIINGKVVVYNSEIKNPLYVRYNWSDNPNGNLYNKENLPACPFRTDN